MNIVEEIREVDARLLAFLSIILPFPTVYW